MQDPFTGLPTLLTGGRLPDAGGRQRLQDDHRGRLEALTGLRALAAECGIGTDPDRDLVTLPEDELSLLEFADSLWSDLSRANREWRRWTPLRRLEDFGFPADADNPLEEPNPRMRRIGGGVEAWAFESADDRSIYKFYKPEEGAGKRIGSAFDFQRGDESAYRARARLGGYGELLWKLRLIEILDGMPTEIVAVTPEGVLVAKQTRGEPLSQGEDMSGRLPKGLIEIPSRFLRADRDHPRLLFADGIPFLVADLHARNFVKAADGSLRVIDLVAAPFPEETHGASARGEIAQWLERKRADPDAPALPTARDEDL